MCFVNDDQVPSGSDQIADAFLIVSLDAFPAPATTFLQRLDGIGRADNLIEPMPDVVVADQMAVGREVARRKQLASATKQLPFFSEV